MKCTGGILNDLLRELGDALENERMELIRDLGNAVHATGPGWDNAQLLFGSLLGELAVYAMELQKKLVNGKKVKVPTHYARALAFVGTYLQDGLDRVKATQRDWVRVASRASQDAALMLGHASGDSRTAQRRHG